MMFNHLSLRLRIFLFFALMALGGSALVIAGLTIGYIRLGEDHALSAFVVAGLVAVIAVFGLTTWVWVLFDEHVARPVERLAADLRARAHTDIDGGIDHSVAKYLGDLAPAADAMAENLIETRNAMALAVGRETARLSTEKARLETLLGELPDGVLFCTPNHHIALYNGNARTILGDSEALGLNRPVSGVMRMASIKQAYDRLAAQGAEAGTDVLVTTRSGGALLEARMRLLWLEGQETAQPGYVLILRDVSKTLSATSERDRLLEDLLKGTRGLMGDLPDLPARSSLETHLEAIEARKAASDATWWPMEVLSADNLGSALAGRLSRKGVALGCDLDDTLLRCDGFAITRLLERLALDWSNTGAEGMIFSLVEITNGEVRLQLDATGDAPSLEALASWLSTPLSPGVAGFTGADVCRCHGTDITPIALSPTRHALAFTLHLAPAAPERAARSVVYDFELLHAEVPEDLAAAPLSGLSFVVFDTETTGLNPSADEICQIAAVRVVNGKLMDSERFDMLVNPGQPIPAASTAVHHITNEMVADAVSVQEALKRFHRYAEGCVLVAHNAPFDMAFLRRREAEIGKRFDQPILDTVLCSAIIYGTTEEHTLDALCERLKVTIPEADRHTAIGDAIGTGDAFRKLIPMLEAAEVPNLGALIKAFDRHSRLIEHLN